MHCFPQKTFHFLSVSNGPTSILSDIVITFPVDTGRKLNVHKTFKRRPGRHEKVIFFVYAREVLKTSRKRNLFFGDVFETS